MNRKKLYLSILIALLFCNIFFPQAARSADFRVGIYSYMAWWKPSFRSFYDYKTDPLFMIGPMISLTIFEDFTFSGVAITNMLWPSDKSYSYTGTGTSGDYTITTPDKDFIRLDIDLSISYNCSSWIKAFIGYKKFMFKENHDDLDFEISAPYTADFSFLFKNEADSNGPGAGITFIWPVFDQFLLSFSTSVIYLDGWFRMNSFSSSGTTVYRNDESANNFYSVGNNSNISLAYIIPDINTVLSLGGRFQFLKNFTEGDTPDLANDYYYGITLSAIYTF